MKEKAYGTVVGLGFLIILSALDISARNSYTSQNASVRSSSSGTHSGTRATVRTGSASVGYRGGVAKTAVRVNTSAWSGYQGSRNYYHPGYYHRHYRGYGWGAPWPYWSAGAYFSYLPDDYTTVYVDGSPYYYCNGYYFSPYSNGYVIVNEPVSAAVVTSQDQESEATVQASSNEQAIAPQPKSVSNDTTTINIPNSKGGFIPVRLIKHKNGYLGSQGEFYTGHPTVAALKALYGD